MTTSAISSTGAPQQASRSDVALAALAKALRHRREEAAVLVRLVEQTMAPGDKGQHVNYYA
jgi:hypothetical protein